MEWKKIEMVARRMWRGEKMELKKEDGLNDTKGLVWWKSGKMAAVGCGGMAARAMCALGILQHVVLVLGCGGIAARAMCALWILQRLCCSSGVGG